MKILHIINTMKLGGAQSLLVSLTKQQKLSGHDVQILQLVESSDRTLVDQVESNGITVETLRGGKSVYSPLKILYLSPHINKYDIVHVHLFPAQYWTVMAKMLGNAKTPLITTEHSTQNKRRGKSIWRRIDSWIYRNYNYVVACADKALETFNSNFKNSGINSMSIPNGIDVDKFYNAKPYSKKELINGSEDTILMTMVARFVYPKRQDVIIKSLQHLPENVHACFVGGNVRDDGLVKMSQLVSELNLQARVHFLYARKDVAEILKSSDFIVMSSEYEGLSLSSLEGMSAGVFIASDVNGLREVVKEAGVLFRSGDDEDLASRVLLLLNNESEYKEVKRLCFERACEYDISRMSKKYFKLYLNCLGK